MSEKRFRTVTAALLSAAVLGLAVGLVALKKQDFSENENRYLEPFPRFGWDTVKDGEYMANLNSYLADHFPFRDFFMQIRAGTEIALGRKEIDGVFIAEDGYLIEPYQKPQNTEKISRILKTFADGICDRDLTLMLAPTAVTVLSDKLPRWAPQAAVSQPETAERIYELTGIPHVDVTAALAAQKDTAQLYYRTDHHWTSYGAYAAYRAYCEAKGLTPVPLEQPERREATHDFHGTLYSKVNDYSRPGDTITLFSNPADQLTVRYPDTGETSDSLYNLNYLDKKDKYSLFLNNIHPLVEITNRTADSDRELVLIKDSYANSVVPFLVRHYRNIYVFDTRYYKMGPSSFIKEHPSVTDVLILYNLNTLDSDLGVRGIY